MLNSMPLSADEDVKRLPTVPRLLAELCSRPTVSKMLKRVGPCKCGTDLSSITNPYLSEKTSYELVDPL